MKRGNTAINRLKSAKKLKPEDELIRAATEALKHANSPAQPTVVEDDEDIFGKHVANELRLITDMRSKQLTKLKIQSILFEAQFGTPNIQTPIATNTYPHVFPNNSNNSNRQPVNNFSYDVYQAATYQNL